MYYITTLLAICILGTSNFISQDSYISGAFATFDVICNAFTTSLKYWRKFESDAVDAEVDFVLYAKAPEPSNNSGPVVKVFEFFGLDSLWDYFSGDEDYEDDDYDYNEFKFDPDIDRIAVIIHGYLGAHTNEWVQDLTRGLFHWKKQNMKVLVVDWFKSYIYYNAAGAVNEVAKKTFKVLRMIGKTYQDKKLKLPYLHIMGHSLGAHIAGLTASKLRSNKKFKWIVDRVTGFDPAKPLFDVIGKDFANYRLNKFCAKFVDVIHTNNALNHSTFGLYDAVGHVDFYPNGGDYQPRCKDERGEDHNSEIKSNSLLTCKKSAVRNCLKGLGNDVSCISSAVLDNTNMVCDHAEAQKYFTESLYGKKYTVIRSDGVTKISKTNCRGQCCRTSIPMGINAFECSNKAYHGRYNVTVM